MPIVLRSVLAALLAAMLASCSERPTGSGIDLPDARGMNVIVISFDALRAESLGIYGYDRGTSPHIDRFAEGALVFDDVQNAANSTPTSFASSWTGMYPSRVFRGWRLQEVDTLAEAFAEGGYHTAAFLNNVQLVEERNFRQGFEEYTVYKDIAPDQRVLKDSLAWLESTPEEPFFLWVHFLSPHAPYDARVMADRFYDRDYRGPFETSSGRKTETDNPEGIARLRDLYDGEVYFADWLFGELWNHIETSGLAGNTIVVMTADHGEELGEHGRFGHHRLYQQVIRVPLLIRHPNATGARSGVPAQNIDLFPTLGGMVGLDVPDTDGVDLRAGVSDTRIRVTVGMTNRRHHGMVMRQGNEKFLVNCAPEYSEEYYDLAADPLESRDILLDRIDEVEQMFLVLEEIMGGEPCQVIHFAVKDVDPTEGLDDKIIEKLKSLGYLQ